MLQHFRRKEHILSAAEDIRYRRSTFGILLLTISVRPIKIDNYVGLILSAVKIDIALTEAAAGKYFMVPSPLQADCAMLIKRS